MFYLINHHSQNPLIHVVFRNPLHLQDALQANIHGHLRCWLFQAPWKWGGGKLPGKNGDKLILGETPSDS